MVEAGATLPFIVFVPFAAAIVALLVGRFSGRLTGLLMVAAAVTCVVQCAGLATHIGTGPIPALHRPWIPGLNISLAFRADAFGLLFASLISGIGTLVGIYALAYMPELPARRLGQFYAALTAFMGAMLGVALADDLVLLFVFWELTSLTSFILIGFWYERDEARKGALTALQVTAIGGMVMMAGFILIGGVCGTFGISEIATSEALRTKLAASPLFGPMLLLVLAGALTKSAQWPFHFWLPKAMVAPTPVSTYLHAATMVKAGVFLMGRMLPIFSSSPLWSGILVPIGLITMVWASAQAFTETDLKALLARSTVAALGLLTMQYGLGAASQDALGIVTHATYKGSLFLVAGIVEHATHTRDIRLLGGLRRRMPVTFLVCTIAALSMAGLPPLLGFHAKEALYGGLLHGHGSVAPLADRFILASAVLSNAFLFAVSFKLILGVFCGEETEAARKAHEASPVLWIPPALLAGLALLLGLATPLTEHLTAEFSSAPLAHVHISLIPSHAGPIVLSLVTIALGIVIYRAQARANAWRAAGGRWPSCSRVWDRMLETVSKLAVAYSTRWQNGSLRWYLGGTLAFSVGLSLYGLQRGGLSLRDAHVRMAEIQWYGVVICLLLSISAVLVVRSRTRIGSAIALTTNGFLTALLFVLYRSPDILLTQILIETVSTIFILLILYFLPPFKPERFTTLGRLTHLALSAAVAVTMFTFVMLSTSPGLREVNNLAQDYLGRTLAEAGGSNAVNVIIVDFRAIDTNGEITVLVVVGLLVYGLLRSRRSAA